MAEVKEVTVPDIGDFDAVDVIDILVGPGDEIAAEDSLITLESDKATMEVPAPFAGVVKEVLIAAGDKVAEGTPVARVEVSGDSAASASDDNAAPAAEPEPPPTTSEPESPPAARTPLPA